MSFFSWDYRKEEDRKRIGFNVVAVAGFLTVATGAGFIIWGRSPWIKPAANQVDANNPIRDSIANEKEVESQWSPSEHWELSRGRNIAFRNSSATFAIVQSEFCHTGCEIRSFELLLHLATSSPQECRVGIAPLDMLLGDRLGDSVNCFNIGVSIRGDVKKKGKDHTDYINKELISKNLHIRVNFKRDHVSFQCEGQFLNEVKQFIEPELPPLHLTVQGGPGFSVELIELMSSNIAVKNPFYDPHSTTTGFEEDAFLFKYTKAVKEEIIKMVEDHGRINIGFLGEHGNGKSSSINTLLTAWDTGSRNVCRRAPVSNNPNETTIRSDEYQLAGTELYLMDHPGHDIKDGECNYKNPKAIFEGGREFSIDGTFDEKELAVDPEKMHHGVFFVYSRHFSSSGPVNDALADMAKVWRGTREPDRCTLHGLVTKLDELLVDSDNLGLLYRDSETVKAYKQIHEVAPDVQELFPMVNYNRELSLSDPSRNAIAMFALRRMIEDVVHRV